MSCPPRWPHCRSCKPIHLCIQRSHPYHTPHRNPHLQHNRRHTRQVRPVGFRHNHSHPRGCLHIRTRKSPRDHCKWRTRRRHPRSRRRRHKCHRHRHLPRNHRHMRPRRQADCHHSRSPLQGCLHIHTRKSLLGHCKCHRHQMRPRRHLRRHRCHPHLRRQHNRHRKCPTHLLGCRCNRNPLLECLNSRRHTLRLPHCKSRTRRIPQRSRPRRHRCHRHPRRPRSHHRTRPRHRVDCLHSRSRRRECQHIHIRRWRRGRCRCRRHQMRQHNCLRRHKCHRHPHPQRSRHHTRPRRQAGCHCSRSLLQECLNIHTHRFLLGRCRRHRHRVLQRRRPRCRKCHPHPRRHHNRRRTRPRHRAGCHRNRNRPPGCLCIRMHTPHQVRRTRHRRRERPFLRILRHNPGSSKNRRQWSPFRRSCMKHHLCNQGRKCHRRRRRHRHLCTGRSRRLCLQKRHSCTPMHRDNPPPRQCKNRRRTPHFHCS